MLSLAANLEDKKVVSVVLEIAQLAGISISGGRGVFSHPRSACYIQPGEHTPTHKELPACGTLVLLLSLSGNDHCHRGTISNVIQYIIRELANF